MNVTKELKDLIRSKINEVIKEENKAKVAKANKKYAKQLKKFKELTEKYDKAREDVDNYYKNSISKISKNWGIQKFVINQAFKDSYLNVGGSYNYVNQMVNEVAVKLQYSDKMLDIDKLIKEVMK